MNMKWPNIIVTFLSMCLTYVLLQIFVRGRTLATTDWTILIVMVALFWVLIACFYFIMRRLNR